MKAPKITRKDLASALPDMTSPFRVEGLQAPIELFRDVYGIPHVKARNQHDAFFGQGFATAQDRLWQMDYLRRWGYGRWAEFAGKSGLDQDKLMRKFQIEAGVKADYRALERETKEMLAAYAAGVNAFIASTSALPVEYAIVGGGPEPWQPWDCLGVYKARHVIMGALDSKRWRARMVNLLGAKRTAQIIGSFPPDRQLVVAPDAKYEGTVLEGLKEMSKGAAAIAWLDEAPTGSNNWALSGSRTATSKPLLAADPHRPASTPNVYYQNHVACPDFDAIGMSFPGCPGFTHYGHNAHVAWTVTNAEMDYQDLYIEKFKKDNPSKYLYRGEWRSADVRSETIKVRGDRPVKVTLTATRHGPIVAGDPAMGHGLAFKYTANTGPDRGADCFLKMLKATSVEEMDESARGWVNPGNNLVFADTSGNIAYLDRSKVPIRSIHNAWLPVPGWTGTHEWKGYVPFDELPRARNPEAGYLATANNRIVGNDYPHYLALEYAPEWRVRRVTARIRALRKKATVKDMASIQSDRTSIPAQQYQKLLAKVEPLDKPSARALGILARWDCSMDKDHVAPTIYAAFRNRLNWVVAGEVLKSGIRRAGGRRSLTQRDARDVKLRLAAFLSVPIMESARRNDVSLLPKGRSWQSTLAAALSEAMAGLAETLGKNMDRWQWGNVHRLESPHMLSSAFPDLAPLLDPPLVSMGGDGDTPQQGYYVADRPFTMKALQVARMVFDLSDWDKSGWVVPQGSSGHPGSPHYIDQTGPWSNLQLIPMLYSWQRVIAEATHHQTLGPR